MLAICIFTKIPSVSYSFLLYTAIPRPTGNPKPKHGYFTVITSLAAIASSVSSCPIPGRSGTSKYPSTA